jgi:hypothetical protein
VNSLNIATLGLLKRGTKPSLSISAIGLLRYEQAIRVASGRYGKRYGLGGVAARKSVTALENIGLPINYARIDEKSAETAGIVQFVTSEAALKSILSTKTTPRSPDIAPKIAHRTPKTEAKKINYGPAN